MEIRTLSEKKNRKTRLRFTRFLVSRFGMSIPTAYGKLHKSRVRRWELLGIENCIRTFSPEYEGELKDFIQGLESKHQFYAFMEKECGMSIKTASIHFPLFDFTELELIGFQAAYDEFQESQGNKKEEE